MKKYKIEVPLNYNRRSKLDKHDFENKIEVKLKSDIEWRLLLKLKKGNFESEEFATVSIITSEDNQILLKFDSIYADSRDWAIDIISEYIDLICHSMSFIIQSQNNNINYFDIKFVYDIRSVNIIEEKYNAYEEYEKYNDKTLTLSESIDIREDISMVINQEFDICNISKFLNTISTDKKIKYIVESYYKSLGNIEYTSKYYNLFVIIEFIEGNYTKELNLNNILTKDQEKVLINNIRNDLNSLINNDDIIGRVINRISQITKTSVETRAEKLYLIITEYLCIKYIDMGTEKIEVSIDIISDFIKIRNALFHAKSFDKKELDKLKVSTHKLMKLCEMIIIVLSKKTK